MGWRAAIVRALVRLTVCPYCRQNPCTGDPRTHVEPP